MAGMDDEMTPSDFSTPKGLKAWFKALDAGGKREHGRAFNERLAELAADAVKPIARESRLPNLLDPISHWFIDEVYSWISEHRDRVAYWNMRGDYRYWQFYLEEKIDGGGDPVMFAATHRDCVIRDGVLLRIHGRK
jgi:hypothetical protein